MFIDNDNKKGWAVYRWLWHLLAITFLSCSTAAYADDYSASISYYPKSLTISYGAKNKTYTLKYDVVNNYTQPLTLSNLTFKPKANATDDQLKNIKTKFIDVVGECSSTDGETAIMPAQGPKGLCHIEVSFDATGVQGEDPDIATENYELSLDYIAGSLQSKTIASETLPVRFADGDIQDSLARKFTIINKCPYEINVGISGHAAQSITPTENDPKTGKPILTSCDTNTDCYPGSACVIPDGKQHGQCFWINPSVKSGDNTLAANGDTDSITFPVYDNGNGFYDENGNYIPLEITWGGGIAGQVNCDATGCQIGHCGAADGKCAPGKGFLNPITVAEFNLQKARIKMMSNDSGKDNVDTYDVTVINGVTIPVSIEPDAANWSKSDPFRCGAAGGTSVKTPLASCSWKFTPPNENYEWVAFIKNGKNCVSNSECGGNEVCGIAFNPAVGDGQGRISKQCGVPRGFYWTTQAVCATDTLYNKEPHLCKSNIPGTTYEYVNLFKCAGNFAQSCYSQGAGDKCCGCSDWDGIFTSKPLPFENCQNYNNKYWFDNALPGLAWLKKGCPVAYVYPYDDKSSTFTCNKNDDKQNNIQSYTITFCPQ